MTKAEMIEKIAKDADMGIRSLHGGFDGDEKNENVTFSLHLKNYFF